MQTAKFMIICIIGILFLIIVGYITTAVKRNVNYNLIYKQAVQEEIRVMVKEGCLKN